MHLVIHEVIELEHVHVANRDIAIEFFAGTAVAKTRLTRISKIGELQKTLDLLLRGAVEYRRCRRHAVGQVASQLDDFFVVEPLDVLDTTASLVVQGLQELPDLGNRLLGFEHAVDLVT